MKTFTAHKVNLNGSLSHKEHLAHNELDQWMADKYGKFATVQVTCDQTGKTIVYTDNGEKWEKVN